MKLTQEEKDQTYTIDILRHVRSGEKYVAATVAVWSVDGDCVGHKVIAVAGPLAEDEVDHLYEKDAYDWDNDIDFDLDRLNDELACGDFSFDLQLADGTGPVW